MTRIAKPTAHAPVPSPQLEVRDLRVVLALARAGSTAAAAPLLHLTQPAVSRALGAAEAHAGARLFTRSSRGLVATDAGTQLLEAAPAMLEQLAELERRLRKPPAPARKVRLTAECFQAYPWLTQVLLLLRERLPDVRIEMPTRYTERAAEALLEGSVDLALLTTAGAAELPSRRMFDDELLFVVAAGHPLASREALRPRDLEAYPLLAPNARHEDEWFLRRVFRGRRPRLRVERLPVTEAIVELARAGVGVGILSEWVADAYLDAPGSGLVVRRLSSGPLRRRWRLAHRPDVAGPLVETLTDALHQARPLRA